MKFFHHTILKFLPLAIACLTGAICLSCSFSENSGSHTETVSSKVKDKKAYHPGEEHAERLLQYANNEDALQDGLLDIRARISNIRSKLGAQAAADYERGFTDYIRTNNDSLARILF